MSVNLTYISIPGSLNETLNKASRAIFICHSYYRLNYQIRSNAMSPSQVAIAVAVALEDRQQAYESAIETEKWKVNKPKPGFVSRLINRLKRK